MAKSDDSEAKPAHTLSDHFFGEYLSHVHDGDADHDHDYFDDDTPLEENPLWVQDHVTLTSVGMDIGSAGTQVVFSRLALRRLSEANSSRYVVTSRETLFQSPVALTPYQDQDRIDDRALGAIIDCAYADAQLGPDDIDTGVVILTGEALRRENAEAITGILAREAGDLVCATAGHHMEAMLAAYGSGAARVSHEHGARILNIDIGGGTTKLALLEHGRVLATAALHVGGRLLAVDADGKVVRIDPAGRYHAREAGFSLSRSDAADQRTLDAIGAAMADALADALARAPQSEKTARLYLTDPIGDLGRVHGIMVSGGVGEFVYGRETRDFGDLGGPLGRALRARIDSGALPWPLLPAGECIRATALGASAYSVQLSGNTSYISDPGKLLPRRNLQVIQPPFRFGETVDVDALADAIRKHLGAFDLIDGHDVALALRWQGAPSYERIAETARGIVSGLAGPLSAGRPLFLMLDGDVAQTLGRMLKQELNVANDVLAIDGVTLWDFDYIDLGRIRVPSMTVPVTIKSLVFSQDPRHPHVHGHAHRHTHEHHREHAHNHAHRHKSGSGDCQ